MTIIITLLTPPIHIACIYICIHTIQCYNFWWNQNHLDGTHSDSVFKIKAYIIITILPMVWETRVQSQVEPYQRLKKMVLGVALLNTQHYKVRIKGEVKQSREWSSTHLHLGVVAIEKGAFQLPSTMVANFTFTSITLLHHIS